MVDSSDIPHSQSGSDESTRKKGRRATQLKQLTANHSGNQRIVIEFDQITGRPIGPKKEKFVSYVALLGRSKASILCEDWDHVSKSVKDQIWDSIMLTFDVPNTENVRKRWISYAGQRWRAFKTHLSTTYIFGEETGKSPLEMYTFLDEKTWDRFVQSRRDPAFQEKRKKAQEIQSKNVHPHILSRGGYAKLEMKIIEEKKKQLQEETSQSNPTVDPPEVVDPPPPPRHHKWKRARQRLSGQYTSEPTRLVAEKIDSLEEQSLQGTFVPTGRQDILATAIGKPDHPGRVLGVGGFVGIRQYHGPLSHYGPTTGGVTKEHMKELIKAEIRREVFPQIIEEVRREVFPRLMELVREQKSTMSYSQQNLSVQPSTHVSTNESCDHAYMSAEALEDDIFEEKEDLHELYVDDHCIRLVALGKVHNLGKTVHHRTLEHDMVRVTVERVLDAFARVPVPTDEVETIGQALNHFIQWPTRLVKFFSAEDIDKVFPSKRSEQRRHWKSVSLKDIDKDGPYQLDPLLRLAKLAMQIGIKDLSLPLEHDGSKDVAAIFSISGRDLMDVCSPGAWTCLTILQIWCTYLHRLSVLKGTLELYGYLDPNLIEGKFCDPSTVKAYIQKTLEESKRECYLAPYLNQDHWQLLILCPRQNIVVFLCSLHKEPPTIFRDIIDIAMQAYNMMEGKSRAKSNKKRPQWICPHSHRQRDVWECGYYVMRHMLNIVSASITDQWKETFDNPTPLSTKEIQDMKEHWANFFFEFSKDYLD